MTLQALVWDVDGTLAETERDGHLVAFNRAFEDLGLPWRWDVAHYGMLLRIAGGRERLLHDLGQRAGAPPTPEGREALSRELHRRKNAHYAALVAEGGIVLREGVPELLEEAATRGLRQAIATTSSRSNVHALLRRELGAAWRDRFMAVVCGEDVACKKPDPEVYLIALRALRLPPVRTLALEDSPVGVAAARAAQVPVVVTRSAFFPDDPVGEVLALGPGLHAAAAWHPALPRTMAGPRVTLDDLMHWHARGEPVSCRG